MRVIFSDRRTTSLSVPFFCGVKTGRSPEQKTTDDYHFGAPLVADKFDPYREALIMETTTIWPEEYDGLPPSQKSRIESQLHAAPEKCAELEYVRVHTGFCRQITVTPEDMARIGG